MADGPTYPRSAERAPGGRAALASSRGERPARTEAWKPWPSAVRGLRRLEAARFVGVSPSKFDQLVERGDMPKPLAIDGCRVWDIRALDLAFDALAHVDEAEANPWDAD